MFERISHLVGKIPWRTSTKFNKTAFFLLGFSSSVILFQQSAKTIMKWIHFLQSAQQQSRKPFLPEETQEKEESDRKKIKLFQRFKKAREHKQTYIKIKNKYTETKQSKKQNLIYIHWLNILINFAGFIVNPTFFFVKLHLVYVSCCQGYYFSSHIKNKTNIQLFFSQKFTRMGLVLAGVNATCLAIAILRKRKI